MRRFILLLSLLASSAGAQATSDARASAAIDRAIARMGGDDALRAVKTMRMDVMTQWQRTTFGEHPYNDQPSYERHQDLRDYTTNSWRNTRAFLPGAVSLVDVVRDTVGGRTFVTGGAPTSAPLNTAYIDERREIFATAPERLLLLARDAGGMRAHADTTIDGQLNTRLSVKLGELPATLFLRRADGLPTMVRFHANEENDFGLAPWGDMEVETWYSGWGRVPPGVLLPRQRDVRRVGRPYKRMTALAVTINAPAPADSFALADSIVQRFLSTERRPMWRVSLDTARIVEGRFATLPPQLGASGAVRVGGTWVLLETGQAAAAVPLVESWLARQEAGATIAAGLVTATSTSNGGAAWFAQQRRPLYIAPGAERMLRAILGPQLVRNAHLVAQNQWVHVGSDSLWLERIDAPDALGALVVYSPSLRWVYGPMVIGRPAAQVEQDAFLASLRARGWPVEWMGTPRTIRAPLPAP